MYLNFPMWVMYVLTGVLGLILGSFANVCIVRMPKGRSVVWPSSHCPLCEHKLSWWENIPIFGFLILGGRCRACRGRISIRYPVVEAACFALSLLAWWFFLNPIIYLLYYCLLIIPLVIISFIDLEHRIIPDVISISGIFVGIAVNMFLAGRFAYMNALVDSVLGMLAGGVFLYLVAFLYEKIKGCEGLGGGDIKLIAMLGAFFGWRAAIFILMLSSVLGSLVGIVLILALRKNTKYAIPFGPFLAVAGLVQLFVGNRIIYWYTHLFY